MQRFYEDVAKHQMTVEHDDGVFRSLLFKAPDTSIYHFRITTWPGHLCISGDAGTFVFSRLHDMFEFFRGDGVNLGYWSEKVEAEDRRSGGTMEYSPEKAADSLESYLEGHEDADAILAEMRPYLDHEYEAASEIGSRDWGGDFLCDFGGCRDYTHRFRWCCHAILWAIGLYDTTKSKKARMPVETHRTTASRQGVKVPTNKRGFERHETARY